MPTSPHPSPADAERHPTRCRVQLLSRLAVAHGSSRIAFRPSSERLVGLLGVRGPMSRTDVAGTLWPEIRQHRAMGNLRTVLWRTRQDGPALVLEHGTSLALDAHVDVDEVRAWARRAMRGEEPLLPIPAGVTCPLLPGSDDDWVVEPREDLRLLQIYGLEAAAQRMLMSGRLGEAAGLASDAAHLDPLRESPHRILIEIFLREGNRSSAVRQYSTFSRLLDRELQVEPSPTLAALVGGLVGTRATR